MSRNDINPKGSGGVNSLPIDRWVVGAGTTDAIKAGEPAKISAVNARHAAILLVDADLTIATDQPMTGVASNDSTETSSASGFSDQYVPLPNVKWEIKARTAANVNTQAEIDVLIGYLYIIDLTSSVFTMDLATSAGTAAFLMVGGDPERSTVWFRIRPDACAFGRAHV